MGKKEPKVIIVPLSAMEAKKISVESGSEILKEIHATELPEKTKMEIFSAITHRAKIGQCDGKAYIDLNGIFSCDISLNRREAFEKATSLISDFLQQNGYRFHVDQSGYESLTIFLEW